MSRLLRKRSGLEIPNDATSLGKTKTENRVSPNWNKVAWIAVAVLVVISGFLVYQLVDLKLNPNKESAAQAEKVVKRVGRLVVLPEGEEPTVATVVNPDQLADQAFFANAQKGYKVLIYTVSQKAILYDPIRDKVVEIAPVNLGSIENSLQGQVNSNEPTP